MTYRFGAVLLSMVAVLQWTTSCGRKEAPPSGITVPPAAEGTVHAGSSMGASPEVAIGTTRVSIFPNMPTRLFPPRINVEKGGGRMESVAWSVNGEPAGEGDRLEPSFFKRGDRIKARVIVDSNGKKGMVQTNEVIAVDTIPWIENVGIMPQTLVMGGSVKAIAQAMDPDGDPVAIRFEWFVDDRQTGTVGDTFSLNGLRKGTWVYVKAVPNDGFADGGWKYSSKYCIVNSPPVVRSAPPTRLSLEGAFEHTIVAEDPDGDVLTYSLEKAPPGMTLSGSTLRWLVPEEVFGTEVEVIVRISDNDGASTVNTLRMTPRKN